MAESKTQQRDKEMKKLSFEEKLDREMIRLRSSKRSMSEVMTLAYEYLDNEHLAQLELALDNMIERAAWHNVEQEALQAKFNQLF